MKQPRHQSHLRGGALAVAVRSLLSLVALSAASVLDVYAVDPTSPIPAQTAPDTAAPPTTRAPDPGQAKPVAPATATPSAGASTGSTGGTDAAPGVAGAGSASATPQPGSRTAAVSERPSAAAGPEAVAIAAAIAKGAIVEGMTMEQVKASHGEPARQEVIPPDAVLWHYSDGEVAFSAGRVTYASVTPRPKTAPATLRRRAEPTPTPAAADDLGPIQAPDIAVGDEYFYRSTDLSGEELTLNTRRTVTAVSPRVVLASLSLDSRNAKPRQLWFDEEWGLLATRNAEGSGLDYSPALQYYDFPLYPGKTWERETEERNTRTGAIRSHRITGQVEQWETVTVPAGTFRGLKVVLRTELHDPSTGEQIVGSDTSWYVPAVRRSVKSLTTGRDGDRRLLELMHFELAPRPGEE